MSFKRSCAASDLGSFPSAEKNKTGEDVPGNDPEQFVSSHDADVTAKMSLSLLKVF